MNKKVVSLFAIILSINFCLKGADTATDKLFKAINNYDVSGVDRALFEGADINAKNVKGNTVLAEALTLFESDSKGIWLYIKPYIFKALSWVSFMAPKIFFSKWGRYVGFGGTITMQDPNDLQKEAKLMMPWFMNGVLLYISSRIFGFLDKSAQSRLKNITKILSRLQSNSDLVIDEHSIEILKRIGFYDYIAEYYKSVTALKSKASKMQTTTQEIK